MRLALNEARKALQLQEVPIGAVVVADGAVVGRGHNLVETLSDPTAHAEMQALTAAASTLGGKYLQGCTLYVTVEPCIMCAGATGWAQVGRVVWGADDPKKTDNVPRGVFVRLVFIVFQHLIDNFSHYYYNKKRTGELVHRLRGNCEFRPFYLMRIMPP